MKIAPVRIQKLRATALLLSGAVVLGSCGGYSPMDPGSGGTGTDNSTIAVGPIDGFGSIFVNDIRFEDSDASITDEDGNSVSTDRLALGMTVRVEGVAETGLNQGTARQIEVFREIQGFVGSVADHQISVNGTIVRIDQVTVVDSNEELRTDMFVVIFGLPDALTNTVQATRIEQRDVGKFVTHGIVKDWMPSQRTFSLGNQQVAYSAGQLPEGFDSGVRVQLEAEAAPVFGAWTASGISLVTTNVFLPSSKVKIDGYIEQFVNLAEFVVSGLVVDASNADLSGRTRDEVQAGARVKLEGLIDADGQTLIASKVRVIGQAGTPAGESFQLVGAITQASSPTQFRVRKYLISWDQATIWNDGSSTDLRKAQCVAVAGLPLGVRERQQIKATAIRFLSDCR